MSIPFQIQSIRLENYRRFEHWQGEFDSRLTLLMGPNGAGKTSILRAIYVAQMPFLHGAQVPAEQLTQQDVRRALAVTPGDESWQVPIFPLYLEARTSVDGQIVESVQRVSGTGSDLVFSGEPGAPAWAHPRSGYQTGVSAALSWFSDTEVTAPLIARIPAASPGIPGAMSMTPQRPFRTRQEVLARSSNATADGSIVAAWLQYNELRALQEGQAPITYRVARDAVLKAINAVDVKYIVRDSALMIHHADQGWRPFDQLSDGQRRLAAIFLHLAMSAAVLNSHLGEQCIAETPGLILIDELDLHLHPKWQRDVIGNLLQVFPKMQFIVASHSPFLLQSAFEVGKVMDVSTGQFVTPGDSSIEDIAEVVMGIDEPQRSRRFLDMKAKAQAYLDLLESPAATPEEVAALKLELDRAMAPFADDPAAAAWLEHRRAAQGL